MSLSPGTRLGAYEILSPLGAGGMGEVYRARDAKLGRDVAVKVLPERFASDASARQRFEREARAVAALSHPNVLSIFDYGVSGENAYAVMELLEGESLRAQLQAGVSHRRAMEIARDVALGLAAAHEKGIVHRDLKPENVFVTKDGRVKILDFGLAKSVAASSPSEASRLPTVERSTEPGTMLGTIGYMSPEQVRGQEVDHRTDIFALGAILYEMVAGHRAFAGSSPADVLSAILREEPQPLESTSRGLPPALELVVRRCLEKSAARRFQSAADVAFALEALAQVSSSASTVVAGIAAPPRFWPAVLVPLAAAAAALAAGFLIGRATVRAPAAPAQPAVRFTIPPEPGTSFAGMLALSADASQLAFVATSEDGNDRLWLRPLASLRSRMIGGTEGASFPFFSPDGRRVGFFARAALKVVDLGSGNVETLCPAPAARGGTWSPEGVILFAPRAGASIDRVPESGGEPRTIIRIASAEDATTVRWPTFLPGGRLFTYLTVDTTGPVLRAASGDGGNARTVTRADSGGFFGGGGLTYALGGRLVRHRFDERAGTVVGAARPVAEDVYWDIFATGHVGFAASGSVLAYMSGGVSTSQLISYDRAGHRQGPVGPAGAFFEPALSPDAKSVALSRGSTETGAGETWLLDLERGGFGRLSPAGVPAVTPVFSPDGRTVAYSTFPNGKVYARDASGAGEPRLLFECGMFCVLEDWTKDGSLLYETLDFRNLASKGYSREPGGGAPKPLAPGLSSVTHARLSPDGRWLAVVSEDSGVNEVLIRSYPGGGEGFTISAGGGSQPFWRADGRELYYVTPDRKIMAVPIALSPRFEPGKPQALFQTRILPEVEARNHYVVTRDGQRFLVNERREEDASRPIVVVLNPFTGGDR